MSASMRTTGRVVLASGTVLGGSAGLATAASAVPSTLDCGPGATAISSTVCEIDFTTAGPATWTPPSNVNTVEALIVAGGGSGGNTLGGYAGGGGEVKIVTLSATGDVTVTVGATDTDSSTVQGATTNTASHGGSGTSGGASGNGNSGAGSGANAHGGGGAGGAANVNVGGPGVTVSSLTSTLFLDDSDCFGGGGGSIMYDYNGMLPSGQQYTWYLGGASCGGGYADQTNDVIALHAAVANSGGGGGANGMTGDYLAGAAGRVTIRFTLKDTGLASTGSDAKFFAALGASMMLLGTAFVVAGRRTRA